jgi:hypothetical protein
LRVLNVQLQWLFLLVLPFCFRSFGFDYYPLDGNPNTPLRWNVNSTAAHTNIVNPSTKAVRYYIASDAYSAANREAEIAAAKACFDQWRSVPGSHLRFEFAGLISPEGLDVRDDHTNVVFWAKNSLSVRSGEMNISNLRAWTSVSFAADGSITEADIVLNGIQYQWFTDFNNSSNQAQFVEAVLLHEIGHFVGLDHAVAGGATVIPSANGVSTEAGLSADEIAAMRFLYPVPQWPTAGISGKIRLNGTPILGAVIAVEDSSGNLTSATVSRADGSYDLRGLSAGNFQLRATPLDPATTGVDKLIQGRDVAPEYANAVTTFSSTANRAVSLANGTVLTADITVTSGPAFRITSISIPTTVPNLVSVTRNAVKLFQGQTDYYLGISGPNLPSGSVLSITGDGLEVGPTEFFQERLAPGLNSLMVKVSVSSNATPGLRSFVVTHSSDTAYANGFLEIATSVPDYNFDNLDDRFQRKFWSPWTSPEAAPTADPDHDGFSNSFEFRTGTIPTSAASFRLALSSVSQSSGVTKITWDSDVGKRYQLYRRASLNSGAWEAIGRPLTATATQMTLTDSVTDQSRFYRLQLQP